MAKTGPILILEDDLEDQELFAESFKQLQVCNKVLYFTLGIDLINYLLQTSEQPFLIISDVNLPMMSGLEFQKRVHENEYLHKKSIPLIFFSTSDDLHAVTEAYKATVQGYFKKPSTYHEFKDIIKYIIDYWKQCKHPYINKG